MPYTDPIYSSPVVNAGSDATYGAEGDAYDGTPVKAVPPAGVLAQGARPTRQLGAQFYNWVQNQVGTFLAALKSDGQRVENDFIAYQTTVNTTLANRSTQWKDQWLRAVVLNWREVWTNKQGQALIQRDNAVQPHSPYATGPRNVVADPVHNEFFLCGKLSPYASGAAWAAHMHMGESRISGNIIVSANVDILEAGDVDHVGNAVFTTRYSEFIWQWVASSGASLRLTTGGTGAPASANADEHGGAKIVFDAVRKRWIWGNGVSGLRYSAVVTAHGGITTPFNAPTTAPTQTVTAGIWYQWGLRADRDSGRVVAMSMSAGSIKTAYTDDGGQTWSTNTVFNPGIGWGSTSKAGLFLQDQTTWFVFTDTRIYKTTDSGATWTLLRAFINTTRSGASEGVALLKTPLGRIWAMIASTTQVDGGPSAQAVTNGVDLGAGGELVYSLDDCVTWERSGLRVADGWSRIVAGRHSFAILDVAAYRLLVSAPAGTRDVSQGNAQLML